MTPQNYPMGSKTNSDGPQRTPVCRLRSLDAWTWGYYSHVLIPKIQWKQCITAAEPALTYCEHMQTASLARKSFSWCISRWVIPFIRSKSTKNCTFFGFRKVGPFHFTKRLQLSYAAAPKPGTHTLFSEQHSAKGRRRTIPWGLKWTLIVPRKRQFVP